MRRAAAAVAVALATTGALVLASCGDEPPYQDLSIQSSDETHARSTGEQTEAGARLITELAGELYVPFARVAGEGGQGNLVYSPAALASVLGQAHLGAQGASADQLAELLGPVEGVQLDAAIDGAVDPLDDADGTQLDAEGKEATVQLEVGAELVGQSGLDWEETFVDDLQATYGAQLVNADFADAPDHGLAELNQRAADGSSDQVTALIPDDALTSDTRLIATAATGLVAPWHAPLVAQGTAPFTRPDGSEVDVEMVGGQLTSHYVLAEDWQSVTIPLAGQDLAATIILPDEGKLGAVQDDLGAVLAEALADGPKVVVDVSIPTFAIASELDVPGALARLGVEAPFAKAGTDFEPMSDDEPLRLDDAFHQAGLVLDAQGLATNPPEQDEAAPAAEGDAAPTQSGLRVDRTFLVVVHDVTWRVPVLVGRVTDPTV